jgi:hypothetical protein
LQAEHQLVARRDFGLPFEIGAALGETGERPRITTADPQRIDVLRGDAQREAHALAPTGHLCATDQRIVSACGDRAQPAIPLPIAAIELQFRREHLHHTAHRITAVERAGRATHHFNAVQTLTVDQRDVLVRRIAEDRIVEAKAIDQMQHFGALQTAHDHHALPRRGLLHEGTDFAVQRVHRRLRPGCKAWIRAAWSQ